ncbi:unnamed protein product [Polarella glacialis]|uniref:Uncharacterized protein n=1 Tax=Polarella glacialis TaxID=89957 RepID=A0A813LN84_POLGL|nr:unnamed protein product [Polarella glacialis]
MCRSCLPALAEDGVEWHRRALGADWWPLDTAELEAAEARWAELFPEEPLGPVELQRFYGRAISPGEVCVFLSHRAAWRAARGSPWSLILEDDAAPVTFLPPSCFQRALEAECEESFFRLCGGRWASVWGALREAVEGLRARGGRHAEWDMLLLGRNRFGQDQPVEGDHDFVEAGFSTCLHAYAVSAAGAERLLQLTAESAEQLGSCNSGSLIPIDDLLPAVWARQHPRTDVQEHARALAARCLGEDRPLQVLAFREELAWQLESLPAADGQEVGKLFRSLMSSDVDSGPTGWECKGPQGGAADTAGLTSGGASLLERLVDLEAQGLGGCGGLAFRCVVLAGRAACSALCCTGKRLARSLAEEAGWRAFVLGLLQEEQGTSEADQEDPLLLAYLGSWRQTAFSITAASKKASGSIAAAAERFQRTDKMLPGSEEAELLEAYTALEDLQKWATQLQETDQNRASATAPLLLLSRPATEMPTGEFRRVFEARVPAIQSFQD